MTLDEYQTKAVSTAIYPGRGDKDTLAGLIYCTLKLNGEAGEIAEKVGKALRDENGTMSLERRERILHELGDCLWYIAALANELDCDLSVVATLNIAKLTGRRERGTLRGDGDRR